MRPLAVSVACVLLTAVAWREAAPVEAQSTRQLLDVDGGKGVRLVSKGNVTLLVARNVKGDVAVFRSVDDGPFLRTEFVIATNVRESGISAWATTHGFFLRQSTPGGGLVRLLRSVDGTRWEAIDSPALGTTEHISDLAQLANGDLVAIGGAAMWRSRDGVTWQPLPLPALFSQSVFFLSMAVRGTTIIVAGLESNERVLWRSSDAGASWTVADLAGGPYEWVATVGDRFVAFTFPDTTPRVPDMPFATSSDGLEWRKGVAPSPLDEGLTFFAGVFVRTASGLFIVGPQMFELRTRLDWCYVAGDACRRGEGTLAVLHTTTGEAWSVIDLESLLGEKLGELAVVDTPAGAIAATDTKDGVTVVRMRTRSWPVIAPRPIPPLRALPSLIPEDRNIEPGRTYRYPHSQYCGFEWLGPLNGRTWKLTRQVLGGPGDRDAIERLPQIDNILLGTIRLTAADRIEYSMDGVGVVGIYGPTTEIQPGCL